MLQFSTFIWFISWKYRPKIKIFVKNETILYRIKFKNTQMRESGQSKGNRRSYS